MRLTLSARASQEESATEIWIGTSVFSEDFQRLLTQLMPTATRFVMVTDTHVEKWAGKRLHAALKQGGLDVHLLTFPAGETHKTRATKEQIEDEMLRLKMGRDTGLIAMGGGVVTDLAGFVASTYCRGIPYVSIPTTLLGMVDASPGGKTGVNTPLGKNMIGAFYPSKAIVIDLELLKTLPEREWINGTAECLKHGMIADPVLFEMLETPFSRDDHRFLKEMIARNCAVKKQIVEQDPKEKGLRRVLNFGHTIGHALETLEEYRISHGEAVAIGMMAESFISMRAGYLSQANFERIERSLATHHFPLRLSTKVNARGIRALLELDKKAQGGLPRFVLLKDIGSVVAFDGQYCSVVDETIVHEALAWLCTNYVKHN